MLVCRLALFNDSFFQCEDDDDDENGDDDTGRHWVRASFERAARRSHAHLDPQLVEYYRSVQLEAPGGAYPCRCRSSTSASASATDNSQDEDSGDAAPRCRAFGRSPRGGRVERPSVSPPERDYEAIADAYYPAELKNRTKFSLLQESPTDQTAGETG